jgi:hypothetical protein
MYQGKTVPGSFKVYSQVRSSCKTYAVYKDWSIQRSRRTSLLEQGHRRTQVTRKMLEVTLRETHHFYREVRAKCTNHNVAQELDSLLAQLNAK